MVIPRAIFPPLHPGNLDGIIPAFSPEPQVALMASPPSYGLPLFGLSWRLARQRQHGMCVYYLRVHNIWCESEWMFRHLAWYLVSESLLVFEALRHRLCPSRDYHRRFSRQCGPCGQQSLYTDGSVHSDAPGLTPPFPPQHQSHGEYLPALPTQQLDHSHPNTMISDRTVTLATYIMVTNV